MGGQAYGSKHGGAAHPMLPFGKQGGGPDGRHLVGGGGAIPIKPG
jgi:hypothetical protein